MNTYEKAMLKIKQDQKCKPSSCIVPVIGTQGPTGPTGPMGPTGASPDFAIGNVITGAPGTSASVTIRKILFY